MDEQLTQVLQLLEKYKTLNLEQSIDWEKFNFYSIVHHSTSIEGASLTEEETQIFLDEGFTAKGKPLLHHQMQKDNYDALLFVIKVAEDKTTVISVDFIKKIAALVMKSTGSVHNTALGSFDSGKGDLRLLNVHAGNTRFVDFTKVPKLLDTFCAELNELMPRITNQQEALITSFDAHFNLVSIHPFAEGNGRASRLLMNYIQHYHNLPLSIVYKEDKADYYQALVETRKNEEMDIFRSFMLNQFTKMIRLEINKHEESQKAHIVKDKNQGFGMPMIF
jgi:Fic family protein